MMGRLAAELFGTLWLVLGGCGAAVLTALFPQVGIGILGVSFAFGLATLRLSALLSWRMANGCWTIS